ncbi:MAG TPA: bacillithiol biosynthesis cysteine-adding enzyme BshC [Kofleriaceae bacterium]
MALAHPWPGDRAGRARAVASAVRPLAPEVHRALVAQQAPLAASPARAAQLDLLRAGAAAVVTGQQVGLFLGPLYTIYKAASAIALARRLADETGAPVVPVFWLQTEDHDLAEIASVGLPGATVEVPVDADNRVSIAHRVLPAELGDRLARLRERLGGGVLAAAHVERLARHYRPGASWHAAFAGVLAELFAPEGLVIVDPRDPALADAAAPIHERAIAEAGPIAAALTARCAELERAGRPVQIHVRPGAPLAFYHPDGAEGPRLRLEPDGAGGFVEVGTGRSHARAALIALARREPRRFSTSALLRPILQDALLPTVANVGGPAEVAYFAQLGPLYAAFAMPMPMIVPRAKFRVTDHRTRTLLARLGLGPGDVAGDEAELLARLRPPARPAEAIRDQLLRGFLAEHAALGEAVATPQLRKALARTRGTVEHAVGVLAAKLERAEVYADGERVDAVRRLRALLVPDGAPQERRLGLAGLAARIGDRALIDQLMQHLAAAELFGAASPLGGPVQDLAA